MIPVILFYLHQIVLVLHHPGPVLEIRAVGQSSPLPINVLIASISFANDKIVVKLAKIVI